MTNPRLLPAETAGDVDPWEQALYAFLVEKGNRSGSRRTVEGYGRMLWPFFRALGKTPDQVTPADVLSWSSHAPKVLQPPDAVAMRHLCPVVRNRGPVLELLEPHTKVKAYAASALKITSTIPSYETWTPATIDKRAAWLADHAVKTWPLIAPPPK